MKGEWPGGENSSIVGENKRWGDLTQKRGGRVSV